MTKERLKRYLEIKGEQDQLRQQIESIEAVLYAPKTQRLTGMPTASSHGNHVEDMAAKHLELVDTYRAKLLELAEEQLAIEKAIEALEPMARMLLRFRYIDGLEWEPICVRMSYSWRQVHRLHSNALTALKERGGDE